MLLNTYSDHHGFLKAHPCEVILQMFWLKLLGKRINFFSSAELKWRVLSEFEESQWIAKNYMLKYGQRRTVIITFLKTMFPVQPTPGTAL